MYRRALSICEKRLGPVHPILPSALNSIARACTQLGADAEAGKLYRRSIAICEKVRGADPSQFFWALNGQGVICANQHRHQESEELYLRATSTAWRLPVNLVPSWPKIGRSPQREERYCAFILQQIFAIIGDMVRRPNERARKRCPGDREPNFGIQFASDFCNT